MELARGAALLCLAASLALACGCKSTGCKGNRQAHVEDIWVPQAEGLSDAPEGDTLAITPDLAAPELPESAAVRLAVARDVPWSQVRDIRERVLSAGKTPYLLVADERKVGAIALYETLQGEAINLFVSAGGKVCVAPQGSPEAKCVQSGDKMHVDRAGTRALIREAVGAYGLQDVLVDVLPDIEWADVVRSVDGARTCCLLDDRKDNDTIRVRLK